MKRVLTAALLVPVVVYIIFFGHPALYLAVQAAVALLCFHEFRRLVEGHRLATGGPLGYVAGMIVLFVPGPELLMVTLIALAALIVAMNAKDMALVLPQASSLLIGVVYIFGAFSWSGFDNHSEKLRGLVLCGIRRRIGCFCFFFGTGNG